MNVCTASSLEERVSAGRKKDDRRFETLVECCVDVERVAYVMMQTYC